MFRYSDFPVGLRLAFRARYLWLAGSALLVLCLAAFLAAMFSGRQPATVALDVGISVIRLLLPLVLVLMIQELLSREFERRYFLSSLSYPRPRQSLLIWRFVAVFLLALALLLAMVLLLGLIVWWVGKGYVQATPVQLDWRYGLVIGFLALDIFLLAAVACLLAVVASTPSFVLIVTFGFMLVARSYAAIIALLTRDAWLVSDAESYRAGVGILGYLLPDLGGLDVREIALYGQIGLLPADWPLLLLSNLAYALGLLGLAVWVIQRKRLA